MKYRVLRYFEGEDQHILIGHYDLKMKANMAITEDISSHKTTTGLKYKIDEVLEELTQSEIDKIFIRKEKWT